MENRLQKEREDVLMLAESFRQLSRLQEECNEELSTFQREKFVAHEEFRNISAVLFKAIDDFQIEVNSELDKLALRINQLEIIAVSSSDLVIRRVFSCPGAHYLACVKRKLLLGLGNGDIRSFDAVTCAPVATLTRQSYDPLSQYDRVTQFYAVSKLFVGFASGMVLGVDPESLQVLAEMSYHKGPITAIHQRGESVVTGCVEGVTVLWNSTTLARVMIAPFHRLPIAGIFHDDKHWVIVDRTGVMTLHDEGMTQIVEKTKICGGIRFLAQHGKGRFVTVADELLMWEGKRVVKTFNAVPITNDVVCCVKPPELLLLGSRKSKEIRFVFLESLLFPRTAEIPEGPVLAIIHDGPVFYTLSVSGSVSVIRANS
jgi:hypothetical protein